MLLKYLINTTSRYIDALLLFRAMVSQIHLYATELQLNKANFVDTEVPFFRL